MEIRLPECTSLTRVKVIRETIDEKMNLRRIFEIARKWENEKVQSLIRWED